MKLLTLLLFIASFHSHAMISPSNIVVERYETEDPNVIMVPVNFAKEFILDESVVNRLKGKIITQVDLIYTAYKESSSFDQSRLNQRRIQELKTLYPQIDEDAPQWLSFEQTGATDRTTANTYFHGFAIHVIDPLNYKFLSQFLGDYQVDFQEYTLIDEEGGDLTYTSGTTLHIPIDAVQYKKDSSEVTGGYTVLYREFRNSAQIMYSGIPMKYGEGTDAMNFNSAGMYEIRAMKDGEELILKRDIIVDFVCTDKLPRTAFYRLDEDANNWEKLHDIDFENEKSNGGIAVGDNNPIKDIDNDTDFLAHKKTKRVIFMEASRGMAWKVSNEDTLVSFNFHSRAWKKIGKRIKRDNDLDFEVGCKGKKKLLVSHQDSSKMINVVEECANKKNFIVQEIANQMNEAGPNFVDDGNRTRSTMLASGMDAGHTYPTLVSGLNSSSFGVYNCDQVFRLKDAVAFKPNYIDESGHQLHGLVTCVIDLNYNGSFSFMPQFVSCAKNDNTVLLLFTKENQTYMIDKSKLKSALDEGTNPTLTMVDMTKQFKSSKDLKAYLNL